MTDLYVKQQINLAEFAMAVMSFSQITNLFQQLFSLFGNFSEFAVLVKPYYIFLDKVSGRQEKEKHICRNDEAVVLKNISYRYPNADFWALRDINLTIHQGDFVSIVGENGSGKTTLMKVLLGFLTPFRGTIETMQRTEYDSMAEEGLKCVSYIPQMFQCYCISVKDNIFFGTSVENGLLDQLLDAIGLAELKNRKNDLYGLEFGGMELSGGQKQKLAILRAAFKRADIFIFDELTSAIDPLQENDIYRALLQASKGKTTIMISHRLALTRRSSLIIVLENGRIVEKGTHEELLRKKGCYAKMWKGQAETYEVPSCKQ